MTTFAEKEVVYSDGQVNVVPLPEAIMANGFIPETRDAPGMPLAAQHLNWLFRDLYRKSNQLQQNFEKNVESTGDQLDSLENRLLPAWVPIPCPMATPPAGYLKCDGNVFDKTKYPELAKGYPSGRLPDLRGEFIRGLDDGRGVDAGRTVLSAQLFDIQEHDHEQMGHWHTPTFIGNNGNSSDYTRGTFVGNRTKKTGGKETRPRNVAFLYIVRAA